MAKKFGLGGGVNALFNNSNTQETQKSENVKQLPKGITSDENGQLYVELDLLKPNPQQPRIEFDEEKLKELSDSIKEHGVLQPITIEDAEDGTFYIIAGERRTRASRLAGLTKIPVQLKKYDEQKKLEIALIENIQRADLNAVEEAVAYQKLMEISGMSQDQVAIRVGKNRSTVANAVRLLKLPEEMQNALIEDKITPGHARALLCVKHDSDRKLLFKKIIENGMNVRKAEEMANSLNIGTGKSSSAKITQTKDPNLTEIEQKFIEALGTKVVIDGTLEKGKITIDYFSKDDLDRLYNIVISNKTQQEATNDFSMEEK